MSNFNEAYTLTLEIEGLIQLAINRGEMLPKEVDTLLSEKVERLGSLLKRDESNAGRVIPHSEVISGSNLDKTIEECSSQQVNHSEACVDSIEVNLDETQCDDESQSVDVESLIKKLAFNDRIRYRSAFFHNSGDEMKSEVSLMMQMDDIDDIKDYIVNDLCVSPDDENFQDFLSWIKTIIQR